MYAGRETWIYYSIFILTIASTIAEISEDIAELDAIQSHQDMVSPIACQASPSQKGKMKLSFLPSGNRLSEKSFEAND